MGLAARPGRKRPGRPQVGSSSLSGTDARTRKRPPPVQRRPGTPARRAGRVTVAWRVRSLVGSGSTQAVAERRGFLVSLGVFHDDQRGGEPHACDHTTTAVAGCHPDARSGCTRRDRRPVVSLGTAVVAAVAVWDVRSSGDRATTGARCDSGVTCRGGGRRCCCSMRRGGCRAGSAACGWSGCRGRRAAACSRRRSKSWRRIWRR